MIRPRALDWDVVKNFSAAVTRAELDQAVSGAVRVRAVARFEKYAAFNEWQ